MTATFSIAHLVALPLAHIGHYLWVFYLIPVLIVVGGIIHTTRADKRRQDDGGDASKRKPRRGNRL